MRFSTFVLKNVLRRRARSALTMTGVGVAVALVVVLVGLSDGFSDSFLHIYTNRDVGLVVSRADSISPLTTTLPQSVADEIASLDGVREVGAGLIDGITIDSWGTAMVMLQGWPANSYMLRELKVLQGEVLSDKDRKQKCIMVGRNLAEYKKLKVGDVVPLSDEDYHVAGIFESDSDLENNMIILLLEDAQKVLGKAGKITGCTVRLKDGSDKGVQAVRAEIEGPLAARLGLEGKLRAKPPSEFVSSMKQLKVVKGFVWAVSAVALLIAVIFVLTIMVMSVFERTREIGILRAIGWRPARVVRMILMESALLSVGGGILGTLAGLGSILALSHLPMINGVVPAAMNLQIVAKGFAIAVLVGLIGAAYPAYRGSKLLPTEALRHE